MSEDRPGHSHHHTHSHSHNHQGHQHPHSHFKNESSSSALVTAFLLNFGFCLVEAFGGYFASSQAVMADALHDFGDSLSLLILLGLRWVSQRPAANAYSFGYRRLNLLGAIVVGVSLVLGSLIILGHSLPLVTNPQKVNSVWMMVLAFLGLGVNGFAFFRMRGEDGAGEKLVSLHLLEDLWGWVIVLVGAIAISLWEWYWLDPMLSVFLASYILWRTFGQWRNLGRLFLLGSTGEFSPERLHELFKKVPGVLDTHHIHVWELDQGFHILTAHIVVTAEAEILSIKQQIRALLWEIGPCEVTIEIERQGEICLDPVHHD